jgi:hypothetical protein
LVRGGMPFAPVYSMSKKNNVNPNFYKVGGREHSEGSDKGEVRQAKTDVKAAPKPVKKKSR